MQAIARANVAKPAMKAVSLSSRTPSASRFGKVGAKAIAPRSVRMAQTIVAEGTCMQFVKGVDEEVVPEVKLTRSRTGSTGTATFIFKNPAVFDATGEFGEITGLYLVDEEGELSTVDVQAKFLNGKPDRIEARYVMKSTYEWERFMRYMERYAEDNGLGFQS
uniref:Photosystem II reaction center Psb28 protein n=1 Tax=Pyramimonas obovata TaxID=1411642 RepID=A0A7S0N7V3_9CHLO|mmetsp:Transcript_21566/g.47327  ORF Transcript_21566/g.47327 Transcript_21566/m.47327 type:complete len:163 (+) Transcript_21566:68-556(+)